MTAGFSLEDVLSAPFPSDLKISPSGGCAAWVFNDAGSRNVWIAPTSAATPSVASPSPLTPSSARKLTDYRGDDGLLIGQLCWTADGDAVLYTRGTCLDDSRPPDPAGVGAQAAPRIWIAPLNQALPAPRLLAAGHSPAVSPGGTLLAYVRAGQIWGMRLPEQSPAACWVQQPGRCTSLRWSPDGTRLAFVSERGDHALVGILDIAAQAVRWLAPGPQHDMAPAWSPDSRRLAFIRLADNPAPTYMSRPSGRPWSVWSADATSAETRCAWRAEEGEGSVFAPLTSGPQLLWTACEQLVFPWESNGWLHLYAVDAQAHATSATAIMGRTAVKAIMVATVDTPARELTPGAGEIFAMTEEQGAGAIICVANRDQREGRRLWRCELTSGRLSALSPGEAMTDLPSAAGGVIVALQADGRTPLRPVVISNGRDLADMPPPPRFPAALLATPQSVAFASLDGMPIHAQLFLPPPLTDGSRHPAIVYCHGGPARQMLPSWHPMEGYSIQYGLNQYLASLGYLVLSVNYRGGTGYGLGFREPPAFGAGGASEYQDVLAAGLFLRQRGDIDPRRIGVYGVSYGGLMTGLALARDSDLFAAGVDCCGVSDWMPAFAGAGTSAAGTPGATMRGDVLRTAIESSPLAAVEQWRSPVLLMHADDDREVPFEQTTVLECALRERGGVDIEKIVFAGEAHDFLLHASWLRFCQATVDWFSRTLSARDSDSAMATATATDHASAPAVPRNNVEGTIMNAQLEPFHAISISRQAHVLKAKGRSIIHMEFGQPSTGAPATAIARAHQVLDSDPMGYWDSLQLKGRLAQHYDERYGISVDPSRFILTCGASPALLLALSSIFSPGQRVALARPGYVAYRNTLKALHLEPVEIACGPDTRFQLTAAALAAIEPAPAGVIVASPANPTGTIIAADELEAIAKVCRERGIRIISDEIYHGLSYVEPAQTILAYEPQALVVSSFSKFFSMAGWRLGWLLAPADHVERAWAYCGNLFLTAPSLSQHAALATFDGMDELEAHLDVYRENRRLLLEALPTLGLNAIAPPDGAFYIYADVAHLTSDSLTFCLRLLEDTGVATAPGIDFDPVDGGHFIRFSFAVSTTEVIDAIGRLQQWFVAQGIGRES